MSVIVALRRIADFQLPLLAGYGFYRPHVQMMDPGFLSGRSQRGPEDQGTWDGGNDPVGIVHRYCCCAGPICDMPC